MQIKANVPEVFLGVFLAVALLAMGWTLESSRHREQNSQQQHAADSAPHVGAKSEAEERIADYTQALAYFTAILAVSTIGLWIVTWLGSRRQSRDMAESIDVSRRAADAALRQANALVAIEAPVPAILQLKLVGFADARSNVSTADPVSPGLPPPFCRPLVLLENRGRTEMRIERFCCDWIVS